MSYKMNFKRKRPIISYTLISFVDNFKLRSNGTPIKSSLVFAIRRIMGVSLIILFMNSCIDDKYDLTKISKDFMIDPSAALPIGSTTITMNDLLNSLGSSNNIGVIKKGADSGLLYLVFDQKIQAFSAEIQVPLPPQQLVQIPPIDLAGGLTTFPFDYCITKGISMNIPLGFKSDKKIESIKLKKFIINISGSSNYQEDGNLVLSFSTITNANGDPLIDTIPIPGNNKPINYITPNKPGYIMRFSGTANLPVDVAFILCGKKGAPLSGGLNLSLQVTSMSYSRIDGYFGQDTLLNTSSTIDVSFLSRSLANNIQWAFPQLTFNIANSYGLPIKFKIDSMNVNSIVNNQNYPVTFNQPPNNIKSDIDTVRISAPTQIGTYHKDSIVFDPSTTTFFNFLSNAPNTLKFHLSALSNPDGNTGVSNVILDTSKVQPNMHLYLPIYFKSNKFGTIDTFKSPLFNSLNSNGSSNNSIESMLFRIVSENTLPVDINLQIILADSMYRPLDTLDNTKIIDGGQPNSNGIVTSPTYHTTNIINLSETKTTDVKKLNDLKKAKYFLILVNLSTTNNGTVYAKFLNSSYMKLTFDCYFKMKIQQTNK